MKKRLFSFCVAVTLVLSLLSGALALTVQESPDTSTYKKVEYDCPAAGLYTYALQLENGTARTVLHYYPEDLSFRRPVLFIAVPDGVDAAAWVEEHGWFRMADEKDFMVIVLMPGEGGWQADELAYTHAVYDFAQARSYYVNDDSAYYMAGYGKGADAVMAEAMMYADLYAGFACLGGTYANAADLMKAAQIKESAEPGRMQSTIPVPIWIGAAEKTAEVQSLIDYWNAADGCYVSDVFSNVYATEIYAPAPYLVKDLALTDDHPSKVMVTIGDADYTASDFSNYLWDEFLSTVRRQDSWQIGALRYAADVVDDFGMDYYEYAVDDADGMEWFYVYVPTAVKAGKYDKVPVMFVTHGSNGGADENSIRVGMINVAEQFNFIMVSCQNNRDAAIWKSDLDIVLQNYPMVDTTRIYVSGQSMGCGFSLTIAENYPELIACVAAASFVNDYREEALAKRTIQNEDILVPVFVAAGNLDYHFPVEGGDLTDKVPAFGEYWLNRAGIETEWVDDVSCWTNTHYYDYSIFHNWVGLNSQGVPMFRWMRVDEKVHAYIVEEGILFYEFAAQFSRGADGTLYYMGIPVTK